MLEKNRRALRVFFSEADVRAIQESLADFICSRAYLRYQIGRLLGDLLGFTGDNPSSEEAYQHKGGHSVWAHYCLPRQRDLGYRHRVRGRVRAATGRLETATRDIGLESGFVIWPSRVEAKSL